MSNVSLNIHSYNAFKVQIQIQIQTIRSIKKRKRKSKANHTCDAVIFDHLCSQCKSCVLSAGRTVLAMIFIPHNDIELFTQIIHAPCVYDGHFFLFFLRWSDLIHVPN